ncbi:MAG: hypothetical protein ACHQIL_14100 [Steroidobacterales bacterium]
MNETKIADWIEDLRAVVSEAQELLKSPGLDHGAVKQVHDKVTESLDRGRDMVNDLEHNASRYVRDNPWQALGIAAAAGLVIGVLVARR